MTKEQMQQAIIRADQIAQRKKTRRLVSFIVVFTICIFIGLRVLSPGTLIGDAASSIFLGAISGFLVPAVFAFYRTMAGIQSLYPEDQELKNLLKSYRESFGEEFHGPWSR